MFTSKSGCIFKHFYVENITKHIHCFHHLVLVFGNILAHLRVVVSRGVQELELLGVVIVPGLLVLGPVDIGGLGGQAGDVGPNEDHAGAHDDKQGLQGNVMLQR